MNYVNLGGFLIKLQCMWVTHGRGNGFETNLIGENTVKGPW